jgi:hypothetical protein
MRRRGEGLRDTKGCRHGMEQENAMTRLLAVALGCAAPEVQSNTRGQAMNWSDMKREHARTKRNVKYIKYKRALRYEDPLFDGAKWVFGIAAAMAVLLAGAFVAVCLGWL